MSARKQAVAAALVTVANIVVAVMVNLLTSGWSWLIFVVLAVLSVGWVGLETWRAVPRRASRELLVAPVLPGVSGGFVPRPEPTGRIVRALLGSKVRKVGITTALAGAGGFGKTTLATAVCELPEIKAAFPSRYWVTVGQDVRGAALADTINDVIERISLQRSGIISPEQAGLTLGGLLKEKGPSLLVVDDVWTVEQLRPFLTAGRGCTLLVTTRIPDLLSDDTNAETIPVDQMSRAQAKDLVTGGLVGLPESFGEQLLDITGRWPLALRLANATLRRTARDGGDIAEAAERLLRRLRELGPTALDVTDAARRERTVAATLESSLGVLGNGRDRALELAIFPEDTEIPVDLVVLLWQSTAGLSADEGEQLCRELVELSLVTWRGDRTRLRVHDVIRTYLRHECGQSRLEGLHRSLLDVVASTLPDPTMRPVPWWTLPPASEYLWRSLAYHLNGSCRTKELAELATATRWVIGKLRRYGPVALAEDLAFVETDSSRELSRFLDQLGHLLVPSSPDHAVVNALAQRLPRSGTLDELRRAALAEVERLPRLVPQHALPDLPNPALNRVLVGHDDRVAGCAFAPDGSWIVSAAFDGLRVWNTDSGQLIRLLEGSSLGYTGDAIALSPDGRLLACEGDRRSIQVLDTNTWEVRHVLKGHRDWVHCCCFSTDGHTLVSAGDDNTIRVWDIQTGKQIRSFKTPKTLRASTGMSDGRLLSLDRESVRIWDIRTGDHNDLPLVDKFLGQDVAISPDQMWAAVPGDDGLAIYDLTRMNEPPRALHHYSDLTAVAFSPNGEMLASGSEAGLTVLWSTTDWRPINQIAAHGSEIRHLAFSPDGSLLATTGDDRTVRLWNPARARADITLDKVANAESFATAPDGTWLAVSRAGSITIYDPATGSLREEFQHPGHIIYGLAPVGNSALSIELHHEIVICEAGNWQMSRTLRHPDELTVSDLCAGRGLVCAVDADDRVVVWDVETWQPPAFLEVDESGLRARHRLATKPNPITERIRRRVKRVGKRTADVKIAIAPDGEWLAVGVGKVVHVVTPKTWKHVTTLNFPEEVDAVMSGPYGWLMVEYCETVQYWNSDTWTIEAEFSDHQQTGTANACAWSPDGSLLATVSDTGTLRIHDSNGWTPRTEIRLDGKLNGCAWLDNDRLVAVGGHGVYWFTYLAGELPQPEPAPARVSAPSTNVADATRPTP